MLIYSNEEDTLLTAEEEENLLFSFSLQMDRLRQGFAVSAVLSHKNGLRESANYEKQAQKLEEKFCAVENEDFCRRILRDVTYYRLKGYFLAVKKQDGKENLSLERIARLHDFDAQMRAVLLYALGKIEIFLRAQFSYFHANADKYGPFGYLDSDNYNEKHDHWDFLNKVEKTVRQNTDKLFVKHYLRNHDGIMPFWALSELITFGQWAYFYEDLKPNDQNGFLRQLYGITDANEKTPSSHAPGDKFKQWRSAKGRAKGKKRAASVPFVSWLHCCRTLRNVCAHCGRLYARNFTWTPDMPKEFDRFTNEKRLWGAVLSLQFLYPDAQDWRLTVLPQMQSLFAAFREQWGQAEYDRLLSGLGFPENWTEWLQKW